MQPTPNRLRQQGATLIVALIMLVLITMVAVFSFNVGKGNMQIVGNMQQRNEVVAAAQEALDVVLSDVNFAKAPNAVFPIPCDGVPNQYCVDTNGDGTTDVKVAIAPPTCSKTRNIPNLELNEDDPADRNCMNQNCPTGIEDACKGGPSFCAMAAWEIRATATDEVTKSKAVIVQGVETRSLQNEVDTACPD